MTQSSRNTLNIILFSALLSFLSTVFLTNRLMAQPETHLVYLPMLRGGEATCILSDAERAMAHLLTVDPGQRRTGLRCEPLLAQVARRRAEDLAARNYFDHVDPDGFAANYLVRQAGYPLPSYYSQAPDANNIEALGAGYGNAEAAWLGLMASRPHRNHLLGNSDFFARQSDFGIGYAYAPDSEYRHYWVIITAEAER